MQTHIGFWSFIILICACGLRASGEPIPARYPQGTIHGFLELLSDEGRVLASGELIQVAHGDQITARTLFRFKDGSIDEETTVFSQRRNFRVISNHHIQKGPFFPHPVDMLIDCRKNEVTVRSQGKMARKR